jgi:hypothetical protein
MITALCGLRTPLADSARKICGNVSPPNANPPIRKKLRRVIPSQKGCWWRDPKIVNMAVSSLQGQTQLVGVKAGEAYQFTGRRLNCDR